MPSRGLAPCRHDVFRRETRLARQLPGWPLEGLGHPLPKLFSGAEGLLATQGGEAGVLGEAQGGALPHLLA